MAAELSNEADPTAELLAQYADQVHAAGPQNLLDAKHASLAIQARCPSLRGRLRPAWDCVRAWHLRVPKKSRAPIPLRVLQALCGAALWSSDFGSSLERFMWFSVHLLLRVCFDGLLRPKEFFNLRTEDVWISPFDGPQAVLILRETKTQSTMGSLQHVILLDPRNVRFLRWHLEGLAPPSACAI